MTILSQMLDECKAHSHDVTTMGSPADLIILARTPANNISRVARLPVFRAIISGCGVREVGFLDLSTVIVYVREFHDIARMTGIKNQCKTASSRETLG